MSRSLCKRSTARGALLAMSLIGILVASGSCTPNLISNETQELSGNITVSFINNTRFRASFSFGSWNSLDRSTPTPGPVALQQLRVEAGQTSAPATLACRRNLAVGTQELVQRVIDTKGTTVAGFDADAFVPVVNFSSAPANTAAAALPTDGTAQGRGELLGVDFKCGDQLFVTFEEDDTAPGGFRIDFQVLPSVEPDA